MRISPSGCSPSRVQILHSTFIVLTDSQLFCHGVNSRSVPEVYRKRPHAEDAGQSWTHVEYSWYVSSIFGSMCAKGMKSAARSVKKRGENGSGAIKRDYKWNIFVQILSIATIMNQIRERRNHLGYLETIKLWHKNESIGLLINSRRRGNV